MKNRAFLILILLLIVADLTIHIGLGYGPGAPDLITVAALLWARRLSGAGAALVGLVLGILADALSISAFGATSVALVVVCFLGARTRDMFEGNSALFIAFYLFIGKLLRDAIWFAVAPGAREGQPISTLWTVAPMHALVTAIAGAAVLMIFRAVVGERRLR